MADVLTKAQRSLCMSQIQGKHTRPELMVRQCVHSLGYRYRIHDRNLPGSPDLVFSSRRKVIFVHGCFWHRHRCKLGKPIPNTRRGFWMTKLLRNKQRDKIVRQRLRRESWDVLVVWECHTRNTKKMAETLKRFLDSR